MKIDTDTRGISPSLGVVLLVGIVLILAMTATYTVLNMTNEREPQPNSRLELKLADDGVTHVLVHDGGETLDGNKVTLQGAANPQALQGERVTSTDEIRFYPVSDTVQVIYTGEHGTGYLLRTFDSIEATVPEPDTGCEWVEQQTNGGTDPINIVDKTVSCDIETDGDIDVGQGGVVIGFVDSHWNNVDIDKGEVYGTITADGDVSIDQAVLHSGVDAGNDVTVDETEVGGPIQAGGNVDIASTADLVEGAVTASGQVSIDQGTIEGPVDSGGKAALSGRVTVKGSLTSGNDIDMEEGTIQGSLTANGSVSLGHSTPVTVQGSIEGQGGAQLYNIDVGNSVTTDSNGMSVKMSQIGGDLATSESVTLEDSTVQGDIYVGGSFSCTNATIGGQDCASYIPQDYTDY